MSAINQPSMECPICYTTTKHYLTCSNKHSICLNCLQKLLHSCECDSKDCCGIGWKCPCCRNNLSLSPYQLVAIGYGSTKIINMIKDEP